MLSLLNKPENKVNRNYFSYSPNKNKTKLIRLNCYLFSQQLITNIKTQAQIKQIESNKTNCSLPRSRANTNFNVIFMLMRARFSLLTTASETIKITVFLTYSFNNNGYLTRESMMIANVKERPRSENS